MIFDAPYLPQALSVEIGQHRLAILCLPSHLLPHGTGPVILSSQDPIPSPRTHSSSKSWRHPCTRTATPGGFAHTGHWDQGMEALEWVQRDTDSLDQEGVSWRTWTLIFQNGRWLCWNCFSTEQSQAKPSLLRACRVLKWVRILAARTSCLVGLFPVIYYYTKPLP